MSININIQPHHNKEGEPTALGVGFDQQVLFFPSFKKIGETCDAQSANTYRTFLKQLQTCSRDQDWCSYHSPGPGSYLYGNLRMKFLCGLYVLLRLFKNLQTAYCLKGSV